MGTLMFAKKIKKGMQIADNEGSLFDVIGIERQKNGQIGIRIASDFSMFRQHWNENGGMLMLCDPFEYLRVA